MSSPALRAHLDPAGKVLDDPPAFLLWDRSCCCCDCCLQVRDSLGIVAIHPVLKVSSHMKIWGFKSGECGDRCGSHLRLISQSEKRCCSHANDSWGVAPEDPDDPSPSTKCCPELANHLDILLGVDCHRPLVVTLEPDWSNDAMFGDGNPGSALHRV